MQQLEAVEQGVGMEGSGQTRLWLASASSGSGKTALACHAAERWLSAGRHETLVVVALASEILAADGSLKSWWRQRFGAAPLESCAAVQEAGASVLLFLDGLDRLAEPTRVVEELAALIRVPGAQVLRVIATATETVADQAFEQLRSNGVGDLVHRWGIPPLTPEEARRLYELLGKDEAGSRAPRLSREVETLLTSPLLVRLARSLGEQEAAGGLTPGRLLRAHADRTVLADPVRAHVAFRLVELILSGGTKSIPLSALLDDPTLRSSLLASGEDAPLRTLVRDHVLLLDRAPSPGGLPVPSEAQLSFAFDAQLDYLAFASMAHRFGQDPARWAEALAARDDPSKTAFGPLVGGLRIFVVESLLAPDADARVDALAHLLVGLAPATGSAVLSDLLATGLDTGRERSLARLAKGYVQQLGERGARAMAVAATAAFRRLVASGRVVEAVAAADLAGRVVPTADTVDLRAHATRFAAWTIGAARAMELGRSLVADARAESDEDALVRALDALREALEASGDDDDDKEALRLEAELLELAQSPRVISSAARVAAALARARRANAMSDGVAREAALSEAVGIADDGQDGALSARVALARASAYAERGLGVPRDVRQAAAHEAVNRACALGDPFLEAVACDVAAWAWHVDHGVQATWIERGLVAASATSALGARARLLDRRGRISLAHGQALDADREAQESAALFDRVGHRRHALRARLHVLAVVATERGRPGETQAWWARLRREASKEGLGAAFEEALLTVLEAAALCDLGRAVDARARLDDFAALRAAQPGPTSGVNENLVLGRVVRIEGDLEGACSLWRSAKAWGEKRNFADFIYQPVLLIARASFDMALARTGDVQDSVSASQGVSVRDAGLTELRLLLENGEYGSDHRERYAGEIRLLLARGLLEKRSLEEARTWLADALEWFRSHPEHRARAEALATQALLLDAQKASLRDLEDESGGASPDKASARGGKKPYSVTDKERAKLAGQSAAIAAQARAAVIAQAESFDEPGDREAFIAHHEATALLARLAGAGG
jgi:hypothetical protein